LFAFIDGNWMNDLCIKMALHVYLGYRKDTCFIDTPFFSYTKPEHALLHDALATSFQGVSRFLVLPICFDNFHWCMILVDQRVGCRTMYQFDPLHLQCYYDRLDQSWRSYLKADLRSEYDPYKQERIIDLHQTDDYNCGIFILLFAMKHIKQISILATINANLNSLRLTLFM
ncbi:hypothetical protein PHYSODRAFT_514071, partial [Phytophthora sojae]